MTQERRISKPERGATYAVTRCHSDTEYVAFISTSCLPYHGDPPEKQVFSFLY